MNKAGLFDDQGFNGPNTAAMTRPVVVVACLTEQRVCSWW